VPVTPDHAVDGSRHRGLRGGAAVSSRPGRVGARASRVSGRLGREAHAVHDPPPDVRLERSTAPSKYIARNHAGFALERLPRLPEGPGVGKAASAAPSERAVAWRRRNRSKCACVSCGPPRRRRRSPRREYARTRQVRRARPGTDATRGLSSVGEAPSCGRRAAGRQCAVCTAPRVPSVGPKVDLRRRHRGI